MRKLIAAINMTFAAFCDHTYGIADEELHQHFTDLINSGDTILYGRKTYQLMEDYWPTLIKQPSGDKTMDDFAIAIDKIPKIVFSHTLKSLQWDSARLAKGNIQEEVLALKNETGGPIFVGSPSLIVECTNLKLVDEYHICVHPVIAGKGLPLFKNMTGSVNLNLVKAKTFVSGVVVLYYTTKKN